MNARARGVPGSAESHARRGESSASLNAFSTVAAQRRSEARVPSAADASVILYSRASDVILSSHGSWWDCSASRANALMLNSSSSEKMSSIERLDVELLGATKEVDDKRRLA